MYDSKPEKYKVIGQYNVSSLLEKLNKFSGEDWKLIEEKKTLFAQEECDSIVLFNLPDHQNKVFNKLIVGKWLFLFNEEIKSVCDIISETYPNGEPKRIILNNLPAGKVIAEHPDRNYHLETCRRIHLPIITNKKVDFNVDREKIPMTVGVITEINNNILHSVQNNSDKDRIHLLIDWGIKNDPYYGDIESDWSKYVEIIS
jgi:hypothetical protein